MDSTVTPAAASPAPEPTPTKMPDVLGQIRGVVDDGKAKVTTSLDTIVKAAHEIADKLQASGVGPIARYAHQAADTVAAWSTNINGKGLEELVEDVRTFARQKPAAAVGLALVTGFVVSRLFKVGSSTASSD